MKVKIYSVFLVIGLIILFLMTGVELAVYDKTFFMSETEQNDVAENTGMTVSEISEVTDEIFRYLKSERMDFDIVLERGTTELHLFNEDEQFHMIDVQNLMVLERVLLVFSTALVIIFGLFLYRNQKKKFFGSLLVSGIVGIILLILAGIIASGDFTAVFVALHEMIFTNELWLMDPATEVLINIVPEPYFVHLALYIGGMAAIGYIITGIVGLSGRKAVNG